MDYEAIDREMSRWLVSCEVHGTRFFLTPEHTASDILARAERFSDREQALVVARAERQQASWRGGFAWEAVTRPSVAIKVTKF